MLSRTFVLLRNLNALRNGAVSQIAETKPLAYSTTQLQAAFAKHFCSNVSNIPVVSYEEIKQLPKQPEKLLIDVREPKELQETGQIPTSINIPLGEVEKVLAGNVDAKAFKAKYGRDFPSKNTEIIFHCKIGRRSHNAAERVDGKNC
ncbi:rhodanese domain-containing protein CG4456-like [Musca vetustissima]|uniref:rhodanese domain-containing protein CG4456-like n=1 Tax=Musca vetustissima TaxID=27455 RepID=UPI002AB73DC6|nr:rhodanese domain-containing protein CG4456-like [Musca vetustissima]